MSIPATQNTNTDVFRSGSVSRRFPAPIKYHPPFLNNEDEDSPASLAAFRNRSIFLGIGSAKGQELLQTTEQFGDRNFKRTRYLLNIHQRNVALAAFDSSDIRPV
jgi:hypothetical protein